MSQDISVSLEAAIKAGHPLAFDCFEGGVVYQYDRFPILITSKQLSSRENLLFSSNTNLHTTKSLHSLPISIVKIFRSKSPLSIITASRDSIILWTFNQELPDARVVAVGLGHVEHISISHRDDGWGSFCCGNLLYAINLITNRKICFEGHLVWDVISMTCAYQSSIVSSSSFSCLAIDPSYFCCCMGTEDGLIRFYDLQSYNSNIPCQPRLLKIIDFSCHAVIEPVVDSVLDLEIVSSIPDWRKDKLNQVQKDIVQIPTIDRTPSLLNIVYMDDYIKSSDTDKYLFAGLTTGIRMICSKNFDIVFSYDFTSPIQTQFSETYDSLPTVSKFTISRSDGLPNCINIYTGNVLTSELFLLRLYIKRNGLLNKSGSRPKILSTDDENMPLLNTIRQLIQCNGTLKGEIWINNVVSDCLSALEEVGVFAEEDICLIGVDKLPHTLPSYLKDHWRSKYIIKELDISKLSLFEDEHSEIKHDSLLFTKQKTTINPKQKLLLKSKIINPGRPGFIDQPVTFRNQVASSGYKSSPKVTKLFTLSGKKPSKDVKLNPKPSYNYSYESLNEHIQFPAMLLHSSSVTSVKFHPSGKFLASCSVDRVVRLYRTPLQKSTFSKDWTGLDGAVTHISWRLNPVKTYGDILLSSSRDGKARMWCVDRSEPVLTFHNISGSNVTGKPQGFGSDLKHASFYYNDKFVLIPHQDTINFYSYVLEALSPSIKPQLNYNKYNLIKSLKGSGQSITSLGCPNVKKSQYVFTGSSDKSINIWDLNVGQLARKIDDCHSRPIHNVSLPDYHQNINNCNNFVSCAITDSIKLWDIRATSSVMHLHGHVNRHANIEACFSPCGRFIASGSEDNRGYVYDIRTGLVLYKIGLNHGNVVTSVSYNPSKAELVTGCYDGKLRVFK